MFSCNTNLTIVQAHLAHLKVHAQIVWSNELWRHNFIEMIPFDANEFIKDMYTDKFDQMKPDFTISRASQSQFAFGNNNIRTEFRKALASDEETIRQQAARIKFKKQTCFAKTAMEVRVKLTLISILFFKRNYFMSL